jgi:hypothetical protein
MTIRRHSANEKVERHTERLYTNAINDQCAGSGCYSQAAITGDEVVLFVSIVCFFSEAGKQLRKCQELQASCPACVLYTSGPFD